MSDAEEWRECPSFPGYMASSLGRVRSIYRKSSIMKPHTRNKYMRITIVSAAGKRNVPVHRLVADAFHGPCPRGLDVNHRNEIKTDNVPWNLDYRTRKDNIRHSVERSWINRRLDLETVRAIRRARIVGFPVAYIAQRFGVSRHTVYLVSNYTSYTEVR